MDTSISIINSRENELQFDISVEGTDVSEMRVRFVVDTENINYVFLCKQSDTAARWDVKIPAMPYLKYGTYNFHIEIITNGYYFNPYNGSIEVTSEPTVSRSEVKRSISPPVVNDVTIKENESENNKIDHSSTTEVITKSDDLVNAFLKNKKTKKQTKVAESTENETEKAKVVKKPIKKRVVKQTLPLKKRITTESKSTKNKQSALDTVIGNIGMPTDPQAIKVRNIINSMTEDK